MKHRSDHHNRGAITALILFLIFALTVDAQSQGNERADDRGNNGGEERGQKLKPRKVAEKPAVTVLDEGDDPLRIEVKFVDGLRFDVNPGGILMERPQKGLEHPQSRRLLARIISSGGRWHRMVALPEEEMDAKRRNAQWNLGKEIADLNSYYILTVPEKKSSEEWINLLNTLPEVEIAQPVPLPAPPPLPGDFQPQQGYLDAATGGIDASSYAWAITGGTGANTRIVDLEYSWNLNHQDLPAVTTLIPNGRTADDPFNDNNHGTAVLGELASLNNGWGTTGIAYDAQIFVAPVNWDNGYNLAAAITNAMGSLSAGDFMLIEQQTRGPNFINSNSQFGLVPSEWQKSVYDAIVTAVGNGIHVIEAAGNGSQDLDDAAYSMGNNGHYPFDGSINSGAIIVGAGAAPNGSTTDRSRLDFSNYGSRVNVQGWGEDVMTTGYGNSYSAEGVNLWYRATFGGTSSASPIVTGAAALIESIQEDLHGGTPVSPAAMRSLLIATGSPQQAGINPVSEHIGPRPSIRAAIQSLDPCVLTCPSNITVSNDPGSCGAVVNYPAPTTSATCGTVTSTPPSGSFFPVGTTTVTVMTTSQVSCTFNVTVNDTEPPVPTCPADITVNNDPGNCSAVVTYSSSVTDNCPGATVVCTPASGSTFPVGTTTVTCLATDAAGNTASCSFTVTVIDNEPPTIAVSLDPTSLWPPNHSMKNITASVTTTDNCPGETFVLTSITSNEPDNGLGDGDFPNDIQSAAYNTADLAFRVRAERGGLGTGRIYTVTYTATDAHGNSASDYATVTVPHDAPPKIVSRSGAVPGSYALEQNYPNPFNPSTTIRFDLPTASSVTLRVFDALGREVAVLVSGEARDAGRHEVSFDGAHLGSGIYSYAITAISTVSDAQFFDVKNMVLMK